MKKIYTTGVFDILHRGHLNVLLEAKKLGDHLVVGVQDDEGVFQSKGKPPTLSEFERVAQLEALPFVDEVRVYRGVDQVPHLKDVQPAMMVQGDDWPRTGERNGILKYLDEQGIKLVLIPYTTDISSSEIKKRVLAQGERNDRDFIMTRVKLLPIADLLIYEQYDEEKVARLTEKIRVEQCFFNPITVTESNIVIDGVNRLEALTRLGARHVTCLQVDYKDVDLVPNIHYRNGKKITRMSEFGSMEGERIEFPKYTKEDIARLAKEGPKVENGATWHKVKTAVIRLRVPLEYLMDGCDFDAFLKSVIAKGDIRYYPANVYVCDEWE